MRTRTGTPWLLVVTLGDPGIEWAKESKKSQNALRSSRRNSEMSLAGLRFGAKSRWNLSAPAETKSGSYIFAGDPSEYHDWEFRTKLRIRMYEEALKSKKLAEESKAVPGSGGSSLSGKGKRYGKGKGRGTQPEEEEAEDEERVADERTAFSMEEDEEDVGSMTPQEEEINLGSLMSPKSTKGDKKTDDDTYDRSSLVHRVLEGLTGVHSWLQETWV